MFIHYVSSSFFPSSSSSLLLADQAQIFIDLQLLGGSTTDLGFPDIESFQRSNYD
jgi:hypothetical protein